MDAAEITGAVLQASWQGSVGIVLLLGVRALAGKFLSGRWLYLLWMLVMVRLLLPGGIFPASPASVPQPAVIARAQKSVDEMPAAGLSAALAVAETVTQRGNMEIRTTKVIREARPLGWRQAVLIVWVSGAGLLALYLICAAVWLDRRIRRGRRATPEAVEQWWKDCRERIPAGGLVLMTSDAVKTPLLFGLMRPKLVLPYGQSGLLSRADWEHVFLHELTHHRRKDNWSNLLPLAALCLHWFNPLVWICQRAIRADRELATDEGVLGFLGEERREDYARTLLRVLTTGGDSRLLPGAIGIVESGAGMKRRFRRIVEFRAPRLAVALAGGAVLCALALVAFGQEKKPAVKTGEETLFFSSLQDMKARMLVAARGGDAQKIAKIQEAADDSHMPFKSEDADDLLEKLMAERDLKTFTFLLEQLRKSHAGIKWQPTPAALTSLLKDDRRDFLGTLFAHRVNLDLFTPDVMKAAGASQPWIEKRVAEVRQQRADEDQLVKAAKTGDIPEMTRLLDAGVDVDCVASNDFTPLTRAAVSGNAEAVKLLLARGAKVDKPRLPGWDYTALCLAKTVEVAQLLKDAGANVNATLFGRPEPIVTYPVRWASTDVVKWFLDNGVDATKAHFDDPSLLYSAGRPETAELLIGRGVGVGGVDKSGDSALTSILRYVKKPAKIAEVLLRHGADPNARNKWGQTPLMMAPDGESVDVLIAAGADILAKDDRGGSVLRFYGVEADPSREEALRKHGLVLKDAAEGVEMMKSAILANDVDQAKRLLAQGVNPDLAGISGFQQYPETSAMVLATVFGHFEIVNAMRAAGGKDVGLLGQAAAEGDTGKIRALLAEGADVDEATESGQTPLAFAVRRGQIEAVRLLLEKGANPVRFDRYGFSPLTFAEYMVSQWKAAGSTTVKQTDLSPKEEEAFFPKAVALMEPHVPEKEMVDANGDTALTAASSCGNVMAVDILLRRGVNINFQRSDGMTPLMIAIVTKPENADKKMASFIDPKTGEKKESSIAAFYVKSLLDKGADPALRNREGKTALDLARERNDTEIMALLAAPKMPSPVPTP